jgi:hypothetical protein
VRHGGRNENGPDQILLDFRIDVAGSQRQILADDGAADGLLGNEIAEQRRGEKAGAEEQAQEQDQAASITDFQMTGHGIDYVGRRPGMP